ncbi:hypothetical protein [Peredibacter starrii]|uniref:Uncharacterized protein n=1 Tax=Peredibacter starrii TaxID=28202 RepID=A0AAX4HUR8_9BACT|nr:hypothetical protein [Peredibacter starrii]WPU66705.1 hypothetical protein SOO65_08095 [Peredibacter starrii]
MKKTLIAALVLATSIANAAEVTVLKTTVPTTARAYNQTAYAKFAIDFDTKETAAKILVTEEIFNEWDGTPGHYPFPNGPWSPNRPMPSTMTVFSDSVKIDNLNLVDDKLIYLGAEGEVECGTMGVTRIFKKPTLLLNGNCKLEANVSRKGELTVTFITK